MWMVNPKILCRKHLLGEHVECHMFVGTLKQGKSIKGYIKNNLLEITSLNKRHDELSQEMIDRGYNHKSPLQSIVPFKEKYNNDYMSKINYKKAYDTLIERCDDCRERRNVNE